MGDKTPNLTLERQVADGVELAEALRRRFPKNRPILLGHSWGTILSTGHGAEGAGPVRRLCRRRADGELGCIVNIQYDDILAAARKAGDAATVARLETMGRPDPTNLPQCFSLAPLIRLNQPKADTAWFAGLRTMPGVTAADLALGAQA